MWSEGKFSCGVAFFEMPSDMSRDVELLLTVMWARILGKFGA